MLEHIKIAGNIAYPTKIIFNDGVVKDTGEVIERGATIVYFEDGSKTIVRRVEGDEDNKELAVLYALVKRWLATHINPFTGEMNSEALGRRISALVNEAEKQEVKVVKTKQVKRVSAPQSTTSKEPERVAPWPTPPAKDSKRKMISETRPARGANGRFVSKPKKS